MTTISLKISEALERRLAQIAKAQGKSRSAVVREAVEKYAAQKSPQPGSCLDIASDLLGSGVGPADLSTNKKHTKGYGQ